MHPKDQLIWCRYQIDYLVFPLNTLASILCGETVFQGTSCKFERTGPFHFCPEKLTKLHMCPKGTLKRKFLVRSCFLITLIKCVKASKVAFCDTKSSGSVTQWVSQSLGSLKQCIIVLCQLWGQFRTLFFCQKSLKWKHEIKKTCEQFPYLVLSTACLPSSSPPRCQQLGKSPFIKKSPTA